MRIGILTLPLHTNYGGILQAYALCKVLGASNHDVELLYLVYPFKPTLWKLVKRGIQYLEGRNVDWFYEYNYPKKMAPSTLYTSMFVSKHIPHTKPIRSKSELRKTASEYDVIIVGSDQVWRPLYAQYIDIFFCSFLPKGSRIKRIAYAVSFGTDIPEYTPYYRKLCGKLIKEFQAVSVRESSGIELIKQYDWNCHPIQVLDPTLLLRKEDYIKLTPFANIAGVDSSACLFYYMLDMDDEKQSLIREIELNTGMSSFTVFEKEYSYYDSEILPQKPVEDWLGAFIKAKMIVTDSFHGCVFSIIFNKPFVVITNATRGRARFQSLLNLFGLEERLLLKYEKGQTIQIVNKPINWEIVNKKRAELITKSLSFLYSNL